MRRVMEEYSRKRHEVSGYDFVYSPHITKSELFEISGHLEWFAESMYPPMELDGGTKYYLKPMNCPFHMLIYKSSTNAATATCRCATSSSARSIATSCRAPSTA